MTELLIGAVIGLVVGLVVGVLFYKNNKRKADIALKKVKEKIQK